MMSDPSSIIQQLATQEVRWVPDALVEALAPAALCLYEWRDYWVALPEAENLMVGQERLSKEVGDYFKLRFENRLGLAALQPLAAGRPLSSPIWVEVLSPKVPQPTAHVAFFRSMLDDLFSRAARLPFTFSGPTSRGSLEALRAPFPLFVLHFLCQYATLLHNALAVIQRAPHRRLVDHPEMVPLALASEADADVLQRMFYDAGAWGRARRDFPLARQLRGYAPAHIWQRLPEETFDTPENRFVLHAIRQIAVAADQLLGQTWWPRVPRERQRVVRELASELRQVAHHPMFAEVGSMRVLPLRSQVLLRQDGYRDMLMLWRRFHQARRPLFAPLRYAIEVRDVATLYEMWVFFALVDLITEIFHDSPTIDLHISTAEGLLWEAQARFGDAGTLVYNHRFGYPDTYSVSLRPDFTWMHAGKAEVVLDAKFRLEPLTSDDAEDTPKAVAKRTDLYKMHAYRDALGVRAAIALYPGTVSRCYHADVQRLSHLSQGPGTLDDVLHPSFSGIGALALRPTDKEA